jgi:hypothetical protein
MRRNQDTVRDLIDHRADAQPDRAFLIHPEAGRLCICECALPRKRNPHRNNAYAPAARRRRAVRLIDPEKGAPRSSADKCLMTKTAFMNG